MAVASVRSFLRIEDLHWIDPSSDACLGAGRADGRAPLLVLVTYRPGYRPAWIDRSYVTQVALQPLTSRTAYGRPGRPPDGYPQCPAGAATRSESGW